MLLVVRLLTVLVLAGTILAFTTGDPFGIGLGVVLVALCFGLLAVVKRRRAG